MTRPLLLAAVLAGISSAFQAGAAPLDALLHATGYSNSKNHGEIELGYDVVNDKVDVLRIRANDEEFGGTDVGDYHGAHLLARWYLTDAISLDGGIWRRRLDYRNDQAKIDSWQIGLQHRFSNAAGWRPALAWRISAWGNQSDQLQKTSPTTVQGITVDSISVDRPQDRQAQLDLIASWILTGRTTWSVFAGAGTSRVEVEEINGQLVLSGCPHQITFRQARTIVAPTTSCMPSVRYDGIPISMLGGDVYSNTTYRAKYLQAGTSIRWQGHAWQVAAGYQYQAIDRGSFDDRIAQQGQSVHDTNHTVIGEIRYGLNKHTEVFARGQAMANQFAGEIPFAYNNFTSHRFNKRYGFVSAGVIITF